MSKITLYPHQQDLVADIKTAMLKYKHILAFAVCSFGKTFTFSEIARSAASKGKRVLILSHRLVLLRQSNEALDEYGIDEFTVINDHKRLNYCKNIYCATTQTVQSRMKNPKFRKFLEDEIDLFIVDEAHLLFSQFLLEQEFMFDKYVIGMTGSPIRIGQSPQLGLTYDIIVGDTTVEYLESIGKLTPLKYYEVPYNISNIKTDIKTGDFQQKSAYQTFDNPKAYAGIVKNYKKYEDGKTFCCFCANIAHAIKVCKEFNDNGYKVKYTISTLNKPNEPEEKEGIAWEMYKDRLETYNLHQKYNHLYIKQEDVNAAFESGEIIGVTNISILGVGWSWKPLEGVILASVTKSLAMYVQWLGRAQRVFEGKKYGFVLDFGTNVERLKPITHKHDWSLWHLTSDSVGVASCKECNPLSKDDKGQSGCGRVVLSSARYCKCGFKFASEQELREVELVERLKDESSVLGEMSSQALLDYAELHNKTKLWCFRQLWLQGNYKFKKGMDQIRKMPEEDRQVQFKRIGLESFTEPEEKIESIKRKLRAQCFKSGMKSLGYKPRYYYPMLDRYEK